MDVFILVAVLFGGVVLVVSRRRGGRSVPAERAHEPVRKPAPQAPARVVPAQADTGADTGQAHRFDAASAAPVPETQVLEGAAFVVDGDTIVIGKTQIRLFGVDAPELNHPYGKKAKWALVALCKGQKVRAEVSASDEYGRTVARCLLPDGRDLSAEMVKLGLAIDWPKYSGGRYRTFETVDARRRLWLADARQKGRMQVWAKFEATQQARLAARQ